MKNEDVIEGLRGHPRRVEADADRMNLAPVEDVEDPGVAVLDDRSGGASLRQRGHQAGARLMAARRDVDLVGVR